MATPAPTTSRRFQQAAAAERAMIARQRLQLLDERQRTRAELDQIDFALNELAQRDSLLRRFTLGPGVNDAGIELASGEAEMIGAPAAASTNEGRLLRGPAVRRAAVKVILEHPARPETVHYRDWYEMLCAAGYSVQGKDPLAVFLTQLRRSPVVVPSGVSGVYSVDTLARGRLCRRLDELHDELQDLAATRRPPADLAAARQRRKALDIEIGRVERAFEEAETVLQGRPS